MERLVLSFVAFTFVALFLVVGVGLLVRSYVERGRIRRQARQ
jgi:hypothetical protein